MNNRAPVPAPGDQSALSLLVNAAHNHDHSRGQRDGAEAVAGRNLAEALRLRGLGDPGVSLEEHLLLQQSQSYGNQASLGLLSQLRDQGNILSQLGQQNQLASLLGSLGSQQAADLRSAIAAQMRQNQIPHLTQSDILALSRSGALSSLSGLLGGGLTAASAGLASELESRQRMEDMERRQRLLAATSAASAPRLESSDRQVSPIPSVTKTSESSDRGVGSARAVESTAAPPPPTPPAPPKPRKTLKPPSDGVPAAPPDTNHPKEEAEKTPGSVIVPCRARGMPMDHNFKTAYFVIPENVKHGEELICSYFACRNAGIKFRYCSHCKVPVAKRNFRKRHKHGGDVEDSGDEEVAAKKGIPSQITAGHEEATEADGISSQSADSNPHPTAVAAEKDLQKGLVHSSMQTFESKGKGGGAAAAAAAAAAADLVVKKVLREDREKRWASLLAKRPATKNGDAMSAWLMEVLAVSDLETPLSKSAEAAPLLRDTKKSTDHNSEPSDGGYNSSSYDDSANQGGIKKSDEVAKAALGSFNAGIMKKKRPSDIDNAKTKSSEGFVGGSFAEWKERKKQKKQSKAGSGHGHSPSM